MNTSLARFFDTSQYKTPVERSRARFLYILVLIVVGLYTIFGLVYINPNTGITAFQSFGTDVIPTARLLVFYLAALITIAATKRGQLRLATLAFLIGFYAIVFVQAITSGLVEPQHGMLIVLFVLTGGLLSETLGIVVATLISIVSIIIGIALRATLTDVPGPEYSLPHFITMTTVTVGNAFASYIFVRFSKLARSEGAAEAIQERLKLAEITTSLSQSTSRRDPLPVVLTQVVDQIVEGYPDIYHAQVFMVDEGGQEAKLVASSGEVGKLLLARAHALGVGSLSVVGQGLVRREPIIEDTRRENTIHRRNELLPETLIEAVFPLRVGDTAVGALDLQSKSGEAFKNVDTVRAFSSLADSLAIAIDNAHLFEETEQRIRENQRLVEQTRTALHEVEQLNERLTGRAWSDYLRNRTSDFAVKLEFDTDDTQPDRVSRKEDKEWTTTLEEAIRLNYLVQESYHGKRVVAVPLRVRGQVVGAMEFELDDEGQFSGDDLNLVQEVGERFGLAAENTRLLEESQRLALREALVNEISTRLQASNNVETTLTEAARSLQDSLKAAKVSIRLGQPPKENAS